MIQNDNNNNNGHKKHHQKQQKHELLHSIQKQKHRSTKNKQPNETNLLRQYYLDVNKAIGRRPSRHFLESTSFIVTPFVSAVASWYLYPLTSVWFHTFVQKLANNNWEPVDGGQLQWSILLPALNGVVMTAISLLYANLISTTGSSLRERQITIHNSLSQEIIGIQNLIQLLKYYPSINTNTSPNYHHPQQQQQLQLQPQPYNFGQYLKSYVQILIEETDPDKFLETLKSDNVEIWKYRDGLHQLSCCTSTL